MKYLALPLIVLTLFATPIRAQQPPPLFTELVTMPPAASTQVRRHDEHVAEQRLVSMRTDAIFGVALDQPARQLGLNLPSGLRTAHFDRIERDQTSQTWVGAIDGVEHSFAAFTEVNGTVFGLVDAVTEKYQVRAVGNDVYALERLDLESFGEELEPLTARATRSSTSASAAGDPLPVADDRGIIDVLMLYTPAARTNAGGVNQINAMASQVIVTTNQIFANSGITTRVRMAGTPTEFALTETDNMSLDLNTLTDSPTANALRNQFSADLVQLLVVSPATPCGIAWLLGNINAADFDGYSIAKTSCIGQYTPAHEMGHNMGSHHDPTNASGVPLFDYSYGYCDPSRRFRTVMATSCPSGSSARILHFSNPQVNDATSGAITGAQFQNNATSINNAAQTVANWRQSTGAVPAPPIGLLAQTTTNSVTLSWVESIGATSYIVQVGSSAGASNLFAGSVGNTTTVSGAVATGNYFFRVLAVNAAGSSPPSQEVQFTIGTPVVAPLAPTNLQSVVAGSAVTLTWNASSSATSYILQVGTAAGASNLFNGSVGGSRSISGQVPAGTYFWRVIASNSAGNSPAAADRQFTVTGACNPPGAPQNFTFALNGRSLTLNWSAPVSGGATGYVIEAGSATGLNNLATVPTGISTSLTAQAPPGTFFVRVHASNVCGTGAASIEQMIVVP